MISAYLKHGEGHSAAVMIILDCRSCCHEWLVLLVLVMSVPLLQIVGDVCSVDDVVPPLALPR